MTSPARQYLGPFASAEEAAVQRAAAAAVLPDAELSQIVRPPLDIELFPPRYGYRTRELDIRDILTVDNVLTKPEPEVNFSGGPASIEGSSRNSQGTGQW